MDALSLGFGIVSYAAAAVAYFSVLALVLPSYPGTRQAAAYVASIGASGLWAGALALALYLQGSFFPRMLILDAVHSAIWIGFVGALVRGRADSERGVWIGNLLAIAALVLCALVAYETLFAPGDGTAGGQALPLTLLALPLLGLLGLEQLFRNSVFNQRPVLRLMCLGIGAIFAVDVFVFSQALLFKQLNVGLWLIRGVVNIAAVPLLLLAVKRQADWGRDVFVSRHVVFYTTTLVAAGLYLLAMALVGYLIAASGSSWGAEIQLLFFLSAAAVLFYGLFSASLRRRLKVFIAKHFYRNRYDYREEWLRLIDTLAGGADGPTLPDRSVKALADIIGSARGELWLAERHGGNYEPHGAWRAPRPAQGLSRDDLLVRFLEAKRWVVDTREYAEEPDKYSNAFGSDPERFADPAIFVPLTHAGSLMGIVRLERPAELGDLSFEDHDLLKTAGQQVAIFLEQERAQEQLSETRQFEAFSRLTAFLMHDLKNLIAQQELVVGNAQRFKHRPEFIEDAVRTIEASVQRMKKVLERLQSGAGHDHTSLVHVEKVIREACAGCGDREPAPVFREIGSGMRVAMDREKLAAAIVHAVRNAQDATPSTGRIEVRLEAGQGSARIDVEDNGCGMEPDFVRNELFKPFRTTKGAKGMGIGAYQIRETLRAAGGDVEVLSEVGRGTTVRMSLPLASPAPVAAESAA
jgi:putative PEP-CTERM system histidine kinase